MKIRQQIVLDLGLSMSTSAALSPLELGLQAVSGFEVGSELLRVLILGVSTCIV